MVHLENATQEEIMQNEKQALIEIFMEVKSDTTLQMIANVVEDIDKIVKATRFEGWQNTHSGQKKSKKYFAKRCLNINSIRSRNYLKKHMVI